MSSKIEDILRPQIPTLMRVFGEQQTTIHTNSEGDENAVTVIVDAALVASGEYGERMERQTTIETASTDVASVGDTWEIEQAPTDDDPYPDSVVWRAEQIIDDDGMTRKFRVRRVE